MTQETGSFTFYNADTCWMFTNWNADHTTCGCFSVTTQKDLDANIQALEKMGYVNRTGRGEHWDYATLAWVQTKAA